MLGQVLLLAHNNYNNNTADDAADLVVILSSESSWLHKYASNEATLSDKTGNTALYASLEQGSVLEPKTVCWVWVKMQVVCQRTFLNKSGDRASWFWASASWNAIQSKSNHISPKFSKDTALFGISATQKQLGYEFGLAEWKTYQLTSWMEVSVEKIFVLLWQNVQDLTVQAVFSIFMHLISSLI